MKELSIEEKAKRYDYAIKRVENIKTGKCEITFMFTAGLLEHIFPELAESKDEKIRKHLISLFEKFVTLGVANECETSEIKVDDILAYLKKQGKENPLKGTLGDVFDDIKFGLDPSPKQGEQKPILDIEIPFGAKDSELEEVSYNIPNGYHAEIEDDKVVIKKGEQKPAWSEEDENIIRLSIENLTELEDRYGKEYGQVGDCIDWLESLRPQNRWKPSNEQMEALEHFIVYNNGSTNYAKDLEELRLQLKKLREE